MKDNFLESDSLSKLIFGINRIQSSPTVAHIKQIHNLYDNFVAVGIDQIYCVSFSDIPFFTLLMPKFSNKITFIQDLDSLGYYQKLLNKKGHPEFLKQYWQFACVLKNNQVQHYIEQEFSGKLAIDTNENIYSNLNPEKILKILQKVS